MKWENFYFPFEAERSSMPETSPEVLGLVWLMLPHNERAMKKLR